MARAILQITFKQIIDASMSGWFEKAVIDASYDEFLLKSQVYNPDKKFKTFKEMVSNNGKANSLHYKCNFPILPYIDLLKKEIPGLRDNNDQPVRFNLHELTVIDSDITNKEMHKLSITYISDTLTLIDSFGDYLLLSYGETIPESSQGTNSKSEFFLLKIVPGLSITNYKIINGMV